MVLDYVLGTSRRHTHDRRKVTTNNRDIRRSNQKNSMKGLQGLILPLFSPFSIWIAMQDECLCIGVLSMDSKVSSNEHYSLRFSIVLTCTLYWSLSTHFNDCTQGFKVLNILNITFCNIYLLYTLLVVPYGRPRRLCKFLLSIL